MTPEQFVYWLQGFMELANPNQLSEHETLVIREHLQLVFEKVTADHDQITKRLEEQHRQMQRASTKITPPHFC